ncbi:MAG: translation factor Sua5 [Bacteroidetes bacterium]|nr:MAG: translation factor Sua5 [Bacteroidota bacterium]
MLKEVEICKHYILEGGSILYPSDTIWGIGCDATNAQAVSRVFEIKRRPDYKSMLILVSDQDMLARYLEKVPGEAREVLDRANRPTTIIYPHARGLAKGLIAPDGSVGIRVCSDPFCHALIQATDRPVVSSSANYAGEPSPSSFAAIDPALHKEVDYVCKWRREETTTAQASSILKLEPDGGITVIRP